MIDGVGGVDSDTQACEVARKGWSDSEGKPMSAGDLNRQDKASDSHGGRSTEGRCSDTVVMKSKQLVTKLREPVQFRPHTTD